MMKDGNAITVSQLNNYIKQVFEAEELLHYVEVVGDVDGLKKSGNAVYFTLKDESASINCVCFYPDKVKSAENGKQVVVRGTVNYWHKAGKISFVIHSCEVFGFGQLFLKFQQLQEKLKAEGLFDIGVKKALPSKVKRLGVVTSKTGAVIHDIATIARRRNPFIDIVVCDVHVQGDGADAEIAHAIETLNRSKSDIKNDSKGSIYMSAEDTQNPCVDVIIVARGGGSKDDLNAFNSEKLARAVFASKVPVVSAVGHESDWTLIDFVADLRAPTPSAAAELCVTEVVSRIQATLRTYATLRSVISRKIDSLFGKTLDAYSELKNLALFKFQEIENRLDVAAAHVESKNPIAVLRRGFAKTNKQFDDIKKDDELEIMFYNGSVGARVLWKKK